MWPGQTEAHLSRSDLEREGERELSNSLGYVVDSPTLSIWKASTSLSGGTALHIVFSWMWGGRGSWTRIPSTWKRGREREKEGRCKGLHPFCVDKAHCLISLQVVQDLQQLFLGKGTVSLDDVGMETTLLCCLHLVPHIDLGGLIISYNDSSQRWRPLACRHQTRYLQREWVMETSSSWPPYSIETNDKTCYTSSAISALTADAIFLPSIIFAFRPGLVYRNCSGSLASPLCRLACSQLEEREGATSRAEVQGRVRERQALRAITFTCDTPTSDKSHSQSVWPGDISN